jgi:uncharacterized membrane protein YdbT with pleckstrin-like domain
MNAGGTSLVMRPHPLFVVLQPLRFYLWALVAALIVLLGAQAWIWLGFGGAPGRATIVLVALLALLGRFLWAVADWATRTYGLTGGAEQGGVVWAERGVLNRRRDELPVSAVRSMAVVKPIEQRLFGIGSVGFASAATSGFEVVWTIVGAPDARLAAARAATRAAGGSLEVAA